jgi:hypothetical protein
MEQVILFLEKLVAFDVSPAIVVALAAVVEFALRFIKSPKALGLVHALAAAIKGVAKVVALLGAVVAKVAELSDKVLPQKVEEPKA